ncbi:hypothetical protein PFISCL1PPCAC_20180 [Pristionchus fissidentatus]|uniref:Uncharacterized protein n=1 Tax=Pristionchus fissidentatus TaxID=1538716 RepID=A0AAV5WDV3_9BILA|nr:hypothetical protein PFISCL1PPCAC_20180 [Pristionchus fissidentatus]
MLSERQRILDEVLFTKCTCNGCNQPAKDAYARSVACSYCPNGICLVDAYPLSCTKCGTPCKQSIKEVNDLNDTIIDHLEEEKTERNVKLSLHRSIRLFEMRVGLLSKYNIPLALLGYEIVTRACTLNEFQIAIKYAHTFHVALLFNLPFGYPMLTHYLFAAIAALSHEKNLPSWGKEMIETVSASLYLSHGPLDSSKNDIETENLHDLLSKVKGMFNIKTDGGELCASPAKKLYVSSAKVIMNVVNH